LSSPPLPHVLLVLTNFRCKIGFSPEGEVACCTPKPRRDILGHAPCLIVIFYIIHFYWNPTILSAVNLTLCHVLVELWPQCLTHGTRFNLMILNHMLLCQKHVTKLDIRPCKSCATTHFYCTETAERLVCETVSATAAVGFGHKLVLDTHNKLTLKPTALSSTTFLSHLIPLTARLGFGIQHHHNLKTCCSVGWIE